MKLSTSFYMNIRLQIFNQKHSLLELWRMRYSIAATFLNIQKILNFLTAKICILFKISNVYAGPIYLMVEASYKCNLECTMCPRQYVKMKREKELLNLNLFHKLLDEVGNKIMFLVMWNFGEPFLNPGLFEMVKLAKKYHIIVGISTNGHLLDKESIHKLLESGLDYLIIALDGASKQTYEEYRKGGDFDKLINNIKMIINMRIAYSKTRPFINLQCLLLRNTVSEMDDIIKLGKTLRVDKVSFKTLGQTNIINKDLLPLNDNYVRNKKNVYFCSRPFLGATILSDGNIVPCCIDVNSEYIMGNIEYESFKSIWNNKKFISFRKRIYSDFKNINICKNCFCSSFNESYY